MKNGLRPFAMHASQDAETANLRPQSAVGPRNARGMVDLAALDPETVAQQYLQNALASPAVAGFTAPEVNGQKSEFKSLGMEMVLLTNTKTVKFRQVYRKIPVYGSLVTVELDSQNELVSMNSSLGEPVNVDPVASVSPAQALQVVRRLAGYDLQQLDAIPRLHYYYDPQANRWRLVYIVEDVLKHETVAGQSQLPAYVDYVIDAHSSELVAELPRTQTMGAPTAEVNATAQGSDDLGDLRDFNVDTLAAGRRRLLDLTHNVHTHDFRFKDARFNWFLLPGDYVENPPDPWLSGAVSAHANSVEVVNFLQNVLLRNGLDNQGGEVVSSVNCTYSGQSSGREWRNAARIPGQMIYGQRMLNGRLVSYAAAKDVVAHELLHGLTDNTARLEYQFESGALNESLSDIFGIIVTNFANPDIDHWDYQMGEDLSNTGIPLRDLRDPTLHGQPAHMDDFVVLLDTQDHGGVHTNSGIHNKAAFLILTAKDANGALLFDAATVAKLFYLALSQHLSRTSGFADSRRGVLLSAMTLFQNNLNQQEKLQAIAMGFEAVGITEV